MRILFICLCTLSFLSAQSIDSLIKTSLRKHHSLESIKYRLSMMDEKIARSQNWANPDLSLTLSDIQFRKPLSRSEERMQYHAVNIKQKFPWFGKLKAQKEVQEELKHTLMHSLETARVALAYDIRITAYTIKELEARIKIIEKYKNLSRQNIKLYTDYISTESMSHASSIDAELTLSKIEIRAERYSAILKSQKEKLRYLVQQKVKKISDRLHMKKPKPLHYYLKGVRRNPAYHQKLANKDMAQAKKRVTDLEIHPDPYVQVGYFNRPDYPDYATVSVGISLPIWGSEKLNAQIAQKEILSAQSEALDYKAKLQSDIRANYANLTEAYRIYKILQNKSLPQLQHLLEISSSAIEEGADLFTYTKVLEEKLALEEERIAIMAEFLRTQAKLKLLTGVQ